MAHLFSRCSRQLKYIIISLAVVLSVGIAHSGDRITFSEYLEMDEEKQIDAAKRHVRKEDRYFTLSYGNYKVYTDIEPLYALRMTVLMDDFYNRFAKVFKGKFKREFQPEVFVLKTRESYNNTLLDETRGYVDAGWSAGMYIPRKKALFADGSYGEDTLISILFHEGTHQLVHSFMGSSVPVWFNEGLATNFESWDLQRSPDNNQANAIYTSNRVNSLLESYPDKGFKKFSRLAEISGREWSASTNPTPNYASAWCTVNFLLSCDDGRKLMNNLVKIFRKGKRQDKILNEKTNLVIEQKVNEYIETRLVPSLKYGRRIIKFIEEKKFREAYMQARDMEKEFPENQETILFVTWLPLMSENAKPEQARKALATLEELEEDDDFQHPELDFALAVAYFRMGNLEKALEYTEDTLEGYENHPGGLSLMERLNKHMDK